jgi:hypothetical protein
MRLHTINASTWRALSVIVLSAAPVLPTDAQTLTPARIDSVKKAVLDSLTKESNNAARLLARADSLRSCVTRRAAMPRQMLFCPPLVEVFADGNVKDVLGSKKASTAASGALGLHFVGNKYDVTGLINVAGTEDTVRTNFGSAILVPATGGALNAAMLNIRSRFKKWGDPMCAQPDYPMSCNIGWRLHADASTRLWATGTERRVVNNDTVTVITSTREVPIWGAGLDFTYSFFRAAITGSDSIRRPAEMLLDIGVMRRAIRGDLADRSRGDERFGLLRSRNTHFDGLEVGLSMIYDKVRASFTYVRLNGNVDGLSGGQIVAAVDLRAALASGILR